MTRVHWLKMARMNWLEWRAESKNRPVCYLEHRIVYCADCETRRSLVSSSGVLICSVCGSGNWMYLSQAKLPAAEAVHKRTVQTRRAVEGTVESQSVSLSSELLV